MDYAQIGLGLALSTAIGGLAFWRRSLSPSGWLGAILVGTITFGFGGWSWGLTLIAFFITSSALSHYKESLKERKAAEKFSKGGRRDLWQALANGGIGALFALAYAMTDRPPVILAAFVGLMATVTADTWATELGVLSPHKPRLITTGRTVEPGTSGGISLVGTSASAGGALLIGVILYALLVAEGAAAGTTWWVVPAATIGGLSGSLIDSLMGATYQAIYTYPDGRETERRVARDGRPTTFLRGWPWLNNDMVNLLSSVAGALIGVGIGALLGALK